MNFLLSLKVKPDKGNLVYEYNPLLNYRLDSKEIIDFNTLKLNFDLNHPVDIISSYTYDGTVNLILNDSKNESRLINTRFTSVGNDKYEIIDRKGNADTNIYDENEFELDTSLYKRVNTISKLDFLGTEQGGNLSVGNYHFYFKYTDGDDNDTDFVSESGLVSVFIGEIPTSINTGIEDLNSNKLVKFRLSNIDPSYAFVKVYYTRSTSAYNENSITKACKLSKKYIVSNGECNITITGTEEKEDISLAEINERREYYTSVKTHAICQNRLFFGNLTKAKLPYQDLEDISLRFLPKLSTELYNDLNSNYTSSNGLSQSYYNSKFIYNKTGYWPDEFYRLGIVYILSDGTLSPVFNIRGTSELTNNVEYGNFEIWKDQEHTKRNIISYNTETKIISGSVAPFENVKGVVRIIKDNNDLNDLIYSINISYSKEVIDYLKEILQIKGFFFVRQKRIPTTLCQALVIPVDRQSGLPAPNNQIERFFDDNRSLDAAFENRLYTINSYEYVGAICPDYDINYPFYNNFFTGEEFSFYSNYSLLLERKSSSRHITTKILTAANKDYHKSKIIGIQDSTSLAIIDDYKWSTLAGYPEEAFRFSYLTYENKITSANNIARGAFGPYLGLTDSKNFVNNLITIKTPSFNEGQISQYIEIRAEDESPFYAISDRLDINNIEFEEVINNDSYSYNPASINVYRGDCYICQFTHRINRNFQDPEAPNNDIIIDPNTWANNYSLEELEKNSNINRGDINAVLLGIWITFKVRSSRNLNIRTLDINQLSEQSLTGHCRTFYPHTGLNVSGSYKIPEALVYNAGFEKSVSDYWNVLVPDVPYLQDKFTNRIAYSNISITNSFKNGFRVFKNGNYRDYNMEYGAITKIVSFFNNIICVFEHGIAKIPVNERVVSGNGSGGDVFINTNNVLPQNPLVLSHDIGSQWQESVISTQSYIYGVDTVAKKIWRTNGERVEVISNFSVQRFLNENISLGEREKTPIIGVRNVKTHYNAFKQDVMFTFYDNLEGFEEKAWNLCWSELLQKWITFYSWIPSYSENINNIWFTFNRDISKIFSKAQVCLKDSPYANGIVLDKVFWSKDDDPDHLKTNLSVVGSKGSITNCKILKDPFENYKLFDNPYISQNDGPKDPTKIYFSGNTTDALSGNDEDDKNKWEYHPYYYLNLEVTTTKDNVDTIYQSKIIIINADILNNTLDDSEVKSLSLKFLNYFWKHGQGGIIEAQERILPCRWYGENHPFEFEFVVADNPLVLKIFENLQIISNNVAPESFHYEIVGDGYDFSDDKLNMFYRQEATKEFYQYNGSDIVFDKRYRDIKPIWNKYEANPRVNEKQRVLVSTIFPLYYMRQDTINELYDAYKQMTNGLNYDYDYDNLTGSEIIFDELLNQFSILVHAKAVDIREGGRIRGNMHYKEDKWDVQINPINFRLKNEQQWNVPPICPRMIPIPADVRSGILSFPNTMKLKDVNNNDIKYVDYSNEHQESFDLTEWTARKETKPRDKFIKIKVRYYNGKDNNLDLVIISALKTLYTISYA